MRRLLAILILLCILYFAVGWGAVKFGFFSEEIYFKYAGLVGGLASVLGLLSFTRPALTKNDLQLIEKDSLISIAKTTEELKTLEEERTKTKEELGDLAIQKKEMELLVKKASLVLFLKEQYHHFESNVIGEIEKNRDLHNNIRRLQETTKKLEALDEEIESDPNVSHLKEIMTAAGKRQPTIDDLIAEMPALSKAIFTISRDITRILNNLVNAILK